LNTLDGYRWAAVWVDRDRALVVRSDGTHDHPTISHLNKDNEDQPQFFAKIAALLAGGDRLLICGPGLSRFHFQTYLTNQVPMLSRQVLASKTLEQPTTPLLIDFAMKFFRSFPFDTNRYTPE